VIKALRKNVQNIARKNNASLTINKATPIFKTSLAQLRFMVTQVPSLITSLNQNDIEEITKTSPKYTEYCAEKTHALPLMW